MPRRVLVIAYYWPPSGGSGVQRWVKFVKYLCAEGWEPVVWAPENADYPSIDPTFEKEVPPQVEVLRGSIWEPYTAYRKLTGAKSTEVTEISSGPKTFKQRLCTKTWAFPGFRTSGTRGARCITSSTCP